MMEVESEVLNMEKSTKRLSRKIRRSFTIQTNVEELGEVLAELLKELNIDKLHILTYKDRIDLFATKDMKPLFVEIYEHYFSLTSDDVDQIEAYNNKIQKIKKSI